MPITTKDGEMRSPQAREGDEVMKRHKRKQKQWSKKLKGYQKGKRK